MSKTRFIIMSSEGNVLTGSNAKKGLIFTPPFLMDEENKTALTFKNNASLPPSLTKKLKAEHNIFSITLGEHQKAGSDAIAMATPMGSAKMFIAPSFKTTRPKNEPDMWLRRS